MITVRVEGMADVLSMLDRLKTEKIPTAMRNGINDTAFGLKGHLSELIKNTFKTPHPSTVKNIFVKKASYQNMQATIWFDQLYRRGVDEYMLPLIMGGGRGYKPSENKLGRYFIPAYKSNGPRIMNKYGNIKGGLVQQVLSRLGKSELYAGSNSNETAASRARRSGRNKSIEYFMVGGRDKVNGLAPGIYQRKTEAGAGLSPKVRRNLKSGAFQKGQGGVIRSRGVLPIMIFANKQPTYKPMLPFFKSGNQYIAETLPKNIMKEIQYHLSKGNGR